MKRAEKKEKIITWLREHNDWTWISPTELGVRVFGLDYARASSATSPLCKELAEEDLLIRNKRGWYRVRT